MGRRLAVAVSAAAVLLLASAQPILAHGERAQEAFLRTRSLAWLDVAFSTERAAVGEPITITGAVKVLEAWPEQLPDPDVAYLTVGSPGPVVVVTDRRVGGVFTPQGISLRRGALYEFRIALRARRAGTWHLHPALSIEGAGQLRGPGREVTIAPGSESFSNPVRLLSGDRVDLETVGTAPVAIWHAVAVMVGLAWIGWWLRRPLLTRMALVDAGREQQLVSRMDRRVSLALVAVAVVAMLAFNVYAGRAWPNRIPLQVGMVEPPASPERDDVVLTDQRARYRAATRTLTLQFRLTNRGAEPVRLVRFTTADVTFEHGATTPGARGGLNYSPDGPFRPGESRPVHLVVSDSAWHTHGLIPLQEAQARIGGLLVFASASGARRLATVDAPLIPDLR